MRGTPTLRGPGLRVSVRELAEVPTIGALGILCVCASIAWAWQAWQADDLASLAARIGGGLIGLGACLAIASYRPVWLALPLAVAGVAYLARPVLAGSPRELTATMIAGVVVAVVAAVITWRNGRASRRVVWAALGILSAVSDRRDPAEAFRRPPLARVLGRVLPIEYIAPMDQDLDAARLSRITDAAAQRVGRRIHATVHGLGTVYLTAAPPPEAESPERRAAARLEAVLSSVLGPGSRIDHIELDEAGTLARVEFSWPVTLAARIAAPGYQRRVARALGTSAGVTIALDWDGEHDRATGVVLPPLPNMIPRPPRDPRRPWQIDFAMLRSGETATWDMDAPEPHILITGGTGSGKTALLRTLLTGLPDSSAVYLIDPKIISLLGIDKLPTVKQYARDVESMIETVEDVDAAMRARYADIENKRTTRKQLTPIVLVIEEGEDWARQVNSYWRTEGKALVKAETGITPTGSEHPVVDTLRGILALGREARVHVIMATQQADARWLSTSARNNFIVRIALGNLDIVGSQQMFNSPVATSGLEGVSGRVWIATHRGITPQQGQVYWTPELDPDLSAADRAILDGLGLGPDILTPTPKQATTSPLTATEPPDSTPTADHSDPPTVAVGEDTSTASEPAEQEEESQDSEPAELETTTVLVPVVEIDDGQQIVVETDTGQVRAVVEGIEADTMDPDALAVSWRSQDDGEAGVLVVSDDESLAIILPPQ